VSTIRYEVRVDSLEEAAFDDRDAAEAYFADADGERELVKVTETILRTRKKSRGRSSCNR
jgi:hypothetical protein